LPETEPAVRLHASYRGRVDIQGIERGGYLKRPVTVGHFRGHLQGRFGLCIYPLRDDGTCAWAAVDIDKPDLDRALLLVRLLHHQGLPVILLTSQQKGFHVALFVDGWVRASAVRPILQAQLMEAGLSPTTEIFPKASYVDPDSKAPGGYLRLPYVGAWAASGARYKAAPGRRAALDLQNHYRPLSLEEFLDLAEASRVSPDVVRVLAEDGDSVAEKDGISETAATAATLPPRQHTVDVAQLRISDAMRELIVNGSQDSTYRSRSEAQQAVACALVNTGYDDELIAGILTNPAYGISDRALHQSSRAREDAIRRSIEKARSTRIAVIGAPLSVDLLLELHQRMIALGLPALAWPVLIEVLRAVDRSTGLSFATARSIALRLRRDRATVYRSGLGPLRKSGILEAVPLEGRRGQWRRVAHRLAGSGGVTQPRPPASRDPRSVRERSVASPRPAGGLGLESRAVASGAVAAVQHGTLSNSRNTAGRGGL